MSEEKALEYTLPPTPDVSLFGLSNREAVLGLANLPPAHPDAISRVRRFLTRCLILDYAVRTSDIPEHFPDEDWGHFIRLFQIRTSKKYPTGPIYQRRLNDEQIKLYEYYQKHYFLPALALGVPGKIAEGMLVTFWLGLACKTWLCCPQNLATLREISGLSAKLFFDQTIVIDAVVRTGKLQDALKRNASVVQDCYFAALHGPTHFTLTEQGALHKKQYRPDQWEYVETGELVALPAWPYGKNNDVFRGLKTLMFERWLRKRWFRYIKLNEASGPTSRVREFRSHFSSIPLVHSADC